MDHIHSQCRMNERSLRGKGGQQHPCGRDLGVSGTSEERSRGDPSENQSYPTGPFWFHFGPGVECGCGGRLGFSNKVGQGFLCPLNGGESPSEQSKDLCLALASVVISRRKQNTIFHPPPNPGHCKAGKHLLSQTKTFLAHSGTFFEPITWT